MGYTTDFMGQFNLDKPLDDKTYQVLIWLNETRRMKWDTKVIGEEWGFEGELYFKHAEEFSGHFGGQVPQNTPGLIDFNSPPITQPGLWCQWRPTEDRMHIEWDGGEKFYHYEEWIKYINETILIPRGYILSGEVHWRGEDFNDTGTIRMAPQIEQRKEIDVTPSEEG